MFTNCKQKAHIYSLVERVILNFGEGADGFEDNVFDCSLLYFSSSLSSLFVSLTNPEKPSARVGGGAVRQSRLPWRIPGSPRYHRLLPVPQGSCGAGLGSPCQGRAGRHSLPCSAPQLLPQAQPAHRFVLPGCPGPSGLLLHGGPAGKRDCGSCWRFLMVPASGCRDRERREKWMGSK